jgi:large subunit ribosomal protein L25
VDHVLFALTVSAKPADIPNEIVVDITELAMGDTIRVADLPLPSGVTTDVDPEEAVVTTVFADVVTETEGEEGEAAAEGGEAADAAGSEGGDEG